MNLSACYVTGFCSVHFLVDCISRSYLRDIHRSRLERLSLKRHACTYDPTQATTRRHAMIGAIFLEVSRPFRTLLFQTSHIRFRLAFFQTRALLLLREDITSYTVSASMFDLHRTRRTSACDVSTSSELLFNFEQIKVCII